MIPFFRRIRKKFADDNKPMKYVRYAIGEIVLVVIGILIALQINNWNNELGNKKDEQAIIKNLNLEFKQNKVKLQEYIDYHKTILASTKDIMKLIGETEEVLDQYNLDSLISQSIDYKEYSPSQAVYTDLISSGKLNLVSSDSLRLLLFEWSSKWDEKREAYKTVDEISQTLVLPYLTKNASMKNIDSYSIVKWKEKSKLITNYYKMFQDLEFENNMENQIWDITNYIMALENLEKVMDKIIDETNGEF
jgi:hypothetical protein